MPYISNNVSKLGKSIACVNLPPVITCRENAPCIAYCYARKGRFAYNNVKNSLQNNLDEYIKFPELYFEAIHYRLALVPYKYFRFHSSGDIVDYNYFVKMCKLARKHKKTKFLCFTKKYEIVNKYLTEDNYIPKNLTIVFSAWESFTPDNPFNLPIAYVRFNKDTFVPTNALECTGFCGDCVSHRDNCWNLKSGDSVVFNKH